MIKESVEETLSRFDVCYHEELSGGSLQEYHDIGVLGQVMKTPLVGSSTMAENYVDQAWTTLKMTQLTNFLQENAYMLFLSDELSKNQRSSSPYGVLSKVTFYLEDTRKVSYTIPWKVLEQSRMVGKEVRKTGADRIYSKEFLKMEFPCGRKSEIIFPRLTRRREWTKK